VCHCSKLRGNEFLNILYLWMLLVWWPPQSYTKVSYSPHKILEVWSMTIVVYNRRVKKLCVIIDLWKFDSKAIEPFKSRLIKMDDVVKASFCYHYTNDSLAAFYQQIMKRWLILTCLAIFILWLNLLIQGAAEITPTFGRAIKIKWNKVHKKFFYL